MNSGLGKRFIHSLRLKNFLSYSSVGEEIELQPLNILIGANTSGKSNLIEALGLIQSLPTDLVSYVRQRGGIQDLIWKGIDNNLIAELELIVNDFERNLSLIYNINIAAVNQRLEVADESIKDCLYSQEIENETIIYYQHQNGKPVISAKVPSSIPEGFTRINNDFDRSHISFEQSVLSQIKDPFLYPEISNIAKQFSQIRLYRSWIIGQKSVLRMPQRVDLPESYLLEDGSNLGLVLNNLQYKIGHKKILDKLNKLYLQAEELIVKIYGGTVQIFIREQGLTQPIPANRLSDGTLRYLFLLALLLDPEPSPVICIEEPEIGLHPDILPTIAELLVEASQRTQLIVTTHSDILVSAFEPESIIICERDENGSHLRRLNPAILQEWLKEFSLGHLWRMGELGGTRW